MNRLAALGAASLAAACLVATPAAATDPAPSSGGAWGLMWQPPDQTPQDIHNGWQWQRGPLSKPHYCVSHASGRPTVYFGDTLEEALGGQSASECVPYAVVPDGAQIGIRTPGGSSDGGSSDAPFVFQNRP